MHILLALIGILGAAAFWWYRMKFISDTANEVIDQVGRVRGQMRRKKMRQKASIAPVTAIDDPVTAAATIIAAIAMDELPMDDARDEAFRREVSLIADPAKLDEALVYAKWAAGQIDNPETVIDHGARFLSGRLDEHEKLELLDMAGKVAGAGGNAPESLPRLVMRLRQKLGLVVN